MILTAIDLVRTSKIINFRQVISKASKLLYESGQFNTMFAYYGLFGLILSLITLSLNFLGLVPDLPHGVLVSNLTWGIGLWLLFDAVDFKLSQTSLLHKLKKRNKTIFYILLISLVAGTVIEVTGAHVFGLWGDLFYHRLAQEQIHTAVL